MTNNEDDKSATSGEGSGGNPGSTGTSETSTSGEAEDTTRAGTKTDIRGTDPKKTDEEPTSPDRIRDGN
jgi:hypothetical protein